MTNTAPEPTPERRTMADLVCVTNTYHHELQAIGQRPCEHVSLVEGEYGNPRKAVRGMLCFSCWEKARAAVAIVADLIVHLRATERGSTGLSERVATSMHPALPIPPSWLAADNIMAALRAPAIPSTANLTETAALADSAVDPWRNLEQVVSSVDGAVHAVLLYRHVQTALAGWPTADADRAMPKPLRCTACSQLALWYRAPLEYLDDMIVECQACGEKYPWENVVDWTTALLDQHEAEKKAAAKARRKVRSA